MEDVVEKPNTGPVWEVDNIPQLDGLPECEPTENIVDEEEYPEVVEQVRVFDVDENKDIMDSHRDIDDMFNKYNILVKSRTTTMNFKHRKSFLFSIEPFKSETVFEIDDFLRSVNSKIHISIVY